MTFINTLTADYEYSQGNWKNLLRFECCVFIEFLESKLNFQHFEPTSLSISEVIDSERRAYLNA